MSGKNSPKYMREWKERNLCRYLHGLWMGRARSAGMEWALSLEDVQNLIDSAPDTCPVLGIPMKLGCRGKRTDNSASIDRRDSSLGYTVDNVRIISWRANFLKSDGTREEFEMVVRNW